MKTVLLISLAVFLVLSGCEFLHINSTPSENETAAYQKGYEAGFKAGSATCPVPVIKSDNVTTYSTPAPVSTAPVSDYDFTKEKKDITAWGTNPVSTQVPHQPGTYSQQRRVKLNLPKINY